MQILNPRLRAVLRQLIPLLLLRKLAQPKISLRRRVIAGGGLFGFWSVVYARYRQYGLRQTAAEFDRFQNTNWQVFDRHYNEQVVTVEEEFELWGEYHQHRHEMRYDLVAKAVRSHLPERGVVLDIGCGAGMVAARIADLSATYIGMEYSGRNAKHAADKLGGIDGALRASVGRCDAERLPVATGSVDVVVMTEVIEHLMRPDLATWEVARVLRPGGVFVMTTNNASELPCRSPLSHPFAWIEKAIGATHPRLISYRPWVWPEKMKGILPDGVGDVYLPHTHHIFAETRELFAAAGLGTFRWSTFEFPPPQAATSAYLERRGHRGRQIVDTIERACRSLPLARRLGCHLFIEARKLHPPVTPRPTPGVWPGPLIQRPS